MCSPSSRGAFVPGSRLSLGAAVNIDSGHALSGDSVLLGQGTVAGAIDANSLIDTGSTHGSVAPFVPASAATPLSAVAPGQTSHVVPTHGVATLFPGSFGDLSVGDYGTLTLIGGGVYEANNLTLGSNARVLVLAPAVLRLAGRVSALDHASIAPLLGTSVNLEIEVLGGNGGPGLLDAPAALNFGPSDDIHAVILAPGGTLVLGDGSTFTGAFDGGAVQGGLNVTIDLLGIHVLDLRCSMISCSRVPFLHCGFIPTPGVACNDGNPCTTHDVCALRARRATTATVTGLASPACPSPARRNHASAPARAARRRGSARRRRR
jgi:hypothetical protein